MLGRPDLVSDIEVLDGNHFYKDSLAQFSFGYRSHPDGRGYSFSVEGEVFTDAIAVNGVGEVMRLDDLASAYCDDETARRIVATALFGYDLANMPSENPSQEALFLISSRLDVA